MTMFMHKEFSVSRRVGTRCTRLVSVFSLVTVVHLQSKKTRKVHQNSLQHGGCRPTLDRCQSTPLVNIYFKINRILVAQTSKNHHKNHSTTPNPSPNHTNYVLNKPNSRFHQVFLNPKSSKIKKFRELTLVDR